MYEILIGGTKSNESKCNEFFNSGVYLPEQDWEAFSASRRWEKLKWQERTKVSDKHFRMIITNLHNSNLPYIWFENNFKLLAICQKLTKDNVDNL